MQWKANALTAISIRPASLRTSTRFPLLVGARSSVNAAPCRETVSDDTVAGQAGIGGCTAGTVDAGSCVRAGSKVASGGAAVGPVALLSCNARC